MSCEIGPTTAARRCSASAVREPRARPPSPAALAAAGVYAFAAFGFLVYGFRGDLELLFALFGVGLLGAGAWALTPTRAPAS